METFQRRSLHRALGELHAQGLVARSRENRSVPCRAASLARAINRAKAAGIYRVLSLGPCLPLLVSSSPCAPSLRDVGPWMCSPSSVVPFFGSPCSSLVWSDVVCSGPGPRQSALNSPTRPRLVNLTKFGSPAALSELHKFAFAATRLNFSHVLQT